MAKNDDEIETSDFKTDKNGKKIRAHRIVFNKGEEDGDKLREECGKKTFKGFASKYDKKSMKEEIDQISDIDEAVVQFPKKNKAEAPREIEGHDVENAWALKHVAAKDDKISYQHNGVTIHHNNGDHTFILGGHQPLFDRDPKGKLKFKDDIGPARRAFKMPTQKAKSGNVVSLKKEETIIDEANAFDIKAHADVLRPKSVTRTQHNVKQTSTGTVYTKRRDGDGMSKEFKRDNEPTQKRGRGRPKKTSFSEAAQFLMSLDEELFDSLMEEGFDAFAEQFEQLDELSKTTLGNYIKKAANDKADTAFHRGYSAYNNSNHKPYSEPMKNKVHRGQENRNKGIKRAVNKLTRESVEQIEDYSLEELQEFMVSEDFEQLDELSKTTLGNYVKKAANDKADTAFHRGYSAYNNSNHKPYSEPMKNKVHKGQENRNKGIKRAINRLTK